MKCWSMTRSAGAHERKEKRRRDVVGKVADDAQSTALKDACPVEFEGVCLYQRELLGRELPAQELGEVPVDFYGGFVTGAGDDFARECCLPGADLNECVTRFRIDAAYDALNPVAVMKEVLTKSFAGFMPFKPFLFHGFGIGSVLTGGRKSCSIRLPCPGRRCRVLCRDRPRFECRGARALH